MFEFDAKSLDRFERKMLQFDKDAKKKGRDLVKTAATELRNDIRLDAPIDTGTLSRSIYVKVLRDRFGYPTAADVRIKTGRKAQKKKKDGFYWRFIEHGTVKMPARPFVKPAIERFKPKLKAHYDEFLKPLAKKFNDD